MVGLTLIGFLNSYFKSLVNLQLANFTVEQNKKRQRFEHKQSIRKKSKIGNYPKATILRLSSITLLLLEIVNGIKIFGYLLRILLKSQIKSGFFPFYYYKACTKKDFYTIFHQYELIMKGIPNIDKE